MPAGDRVVLIGPGNLGQIRTMFSELQIGGLLEAGADVPEELRSVPQLGDAKSYQPQPQEVFVCCAIQDPERRLAMCRDLKSRGARFITLVHPTAQIAPETTIGDGCIIMSYAIIDVAANIGEYVLFHNHTVVGHDAVVGDGAIVLAGAVVRGRAVLGKGVLASELSCCDIGSRIGDYATIAPRTLAIHEVPPRTVVTGGLAQRTVIATPEERRP